MVARGETLSKRGLVVGVGINDAPFPIQRAPYVDSEGTYHKRWVDPLYEAWKNVLTRTSDPKYIAKFPSYSTVNFCLEWKYLMNFYRWAETKDYEGKVLDKDIIGDGTLYSPETCCFVTERVNNFLVGHKIKKELPLGVTWESDRCKFKAEIALNGKSKRLGNFLNKWEAHLVYCKAKLELAFVVIEQEKVEDYIAVALINKLQKKVDEAEILYQQSLI